nr:adhesion G protein-coupled receptor E3-like [Chrysemys picta bellii]
MEICDDINECLGPSKPDCGRNTHCTNVPASYYCTCTDGYEPSSGKAKFMNASENTCQDIDECQGPNPADCGPHANCTNVPGNYSCTCIDGYESSSGKANFTHASENTGQTAHSGIAICTDIAALDIDECRKSPGICGLKATCINTLGSYWCECRAGYFPSTRNSNLCEAPSINSSAEFEGIKETCRNFSLQNVTLRFSALLNSTALWDGGDKGEVGSAMTVLLQSVELATLATALRSPERTTQNIMTESMAVETRLVTGNCSRDSEVFTLRAYEEMMVVHCDTVTGAATRGLGAAAFISYSTLDSIVSARRLSEGNLPAGGKLEKSHLNSRVTKKEEEEALCVYWKVEAESGSWSPDGCTAVHTNSTHTTCSCDHLSSFAVLMASTTVTAACAVIAGLLHYLFLACFSWMFLEGLHLFLTVRNLKVVNYTSASQFKKRFMYPFGYGFPALVVAISAAVNPKGYGTSEHCWLSLDRGFIWSFLGPVCAIILINITFFALTLRILRNRLSSLNADVSTLRDHRLLTFKAIAQLFILGCTWSLGLLQVGPAATVMAYLFTIINSLQGAFIFLVHCLLNLQVREEYRRWIKGFRMFSTKSQTSDLSMSAVPTTSTKMV